LASIYEAEGKIAEAADILQDVQVEIMGTMEKKEKAEFLLEQIRLTMDKNDFVRAEIICKKVNSNLSS
jgi:26S proteasome regulatory subunit N5